MTLFSHFLFFLTSLSLSLSLSLDFSFLSEPDERPPRHPLHAHTIQARTHRKSMCCAGRRRWRSGEGRGGGRAGWEVVEERREGGCALSTEGERGREEGGNGGLNASHVKLMRTNLQKMESCFSFCNSSLLLFCFLSRSEPLSRLIFQYRTSTPTKIPLRADYPENRRLAMQLAKH